MILHVYYSCINFLNLRKLAMNMHNVAKESYNHVKKTVCFPLGGFHLSQFLSFCYVSVIFGEDVAFGGVFRCTVGLKDKYGT